MSQSINGLGGYLQQIGALSPDPDFNMAMVADDVGRQLDAYFRPQVPERPSDLPSDNECVRIRQLVSGDPRATHVDARIAKLFGSWRLAVMRVECITERRLSVLAHAVRAYDKVRARGNGSEFQDERAQLVSFLQDEYGLDDLALKKLIGNPRGSQRWAQRLDVLPMHLRFEEHDKAAGDDAPIE